eukprot:TRINITY_DN50131_c0_g1_i1.p1 TRINITY_DN50131_c0_g1~~TRINITY_DN50131_c0_g1_i1.p1  ORF type:complete len:291 (-),score=32.87 TRINITY_DN50131_c0_g1_i1:67-939(-)
MVKHIINPYRASASGGQSIAFKSALVLTALFVAISLVCFLGEPLVSYLDRTAVAEEHLKRAALNRTEVAQEIHWHHLLLLGLNPTQASHGRRMITAIVLGALIGLERREANRGAGIRTMSIVSLGSCMFSIASSFAFQDSTQSWDASRVAAALPSGVGFLGGALIFKDAGEIKGLTTAAGVWLSCAVGMCCGGGMYFVAFFGVASMVAMLRFGPRSIDAFEADFFEDQQEKPEQSTGYLSSASKAPTPSFEAPLLRAETASQASEMYGRNRSQSGLGLGRRPTTTLSVDE